MDQQLLHAVRERARRRKRRRGRKKGPGLKPPPAASPTGAAGRDGLSLMPLLRSTGRLPARDLFWHYPHFANQGGRPGSAIRRGDWKLIEWHETGKVELYNLKTDPSEKADVALAQPDIAKRLQGALHDWRESLGAKMPIHK